MFEIYFLAKFGLNLFLSCPLDEAIVKLAELAPRNSVKMSTAPSVSVVGFVFSLHLFSPTHAIGNYIYLRNLSSCSAMATLKKCMGGVRL